MDEAMERGWWRASRACRVALGALLGLQGLALAEVPGHRSEGIHTALVRDAKLVYAEELAAFRRDPRGQPGPWPRFMPTKIDAFASSGRTVLGVSSTRCIGFEGPGYAPSHCDGPWFMVVELDGLPDVGDPFDVGDERIRAIGLFYGDRHAGSRSGCLGYPTAGVFKVVEQGESRVRIRIDVKFDLLAHAWYPAACGVQEVSGDFVFVETSTDLFASGGLGTLF